MIGIIVAGSQIAFSLGNNTVCRVVDQFAVGVALVAISAVLQVELLVA